MAPVQALGQNAVNLTDPAACAAAIHANQPRAVINGKRPIDTAGYAKLTKKSKDESNAPRKPRKPRTLPEGLPRVERLIEPDNIICPCRCGDMGKIGEDRSKWLDVIPAHYQVNIHGFVRALRPDIML